MFGKQSRLLTKRQFDHVFQCPKKFVAKEIILFVRENDLAYSRLGLAFSKRYIAKAVNRNRVKRVLRESFRHHQLPSVDIVAIARHQLATTPNPVLFQRLDTLWQKINQFYAK